MSLGGTIIKMIVGGAGGKGEKDADEVFLLIALLICL